MRRPSLLLLALVTVGATACGRAETPDRTPLAEQWLQRAKTGYQSGDFEDAYEASKHALEASAQDPEIRTIAARVALSRLEFREALRLTEGLQTTEAHGIRGRSFWYAGDIEQAADELEAMLRDPQMKDPWSREVARLARQGNGRHPFAIEGGIVSLVDMPRAVAQSPLGPAHVVPCELEGERILALVATGSSEVIIDQNARHEPAWVNLRFGDHVEVKDVPALTGDLSPVSRQLGVPIKALLGVNLLRHIHATFDRRADQFIVRKEDAPPPPEATRVPLWYIRGGGMTVRAHVALGEGGETSLLVDSSRFLPLALEDGVWKKAGVDVHSLTPVPDAPAIKRGLVPVFRLGGFDLAKMPAFEGVDLNDIRKNVDVDIGGIVGAELLAFFRVTFADDGRFVWMEPDPTLIVPANAPPSQPPPANTPDPGPAPKSPAPAGKPASPAKHGEPSASTPGTASAPKGGGRP